MNGLMYRLVARITLFDEPAGRVAELTSRLKRNHVGLVVVVDGPDADWPESVRRDATIEFPVDDFYGAKTRAAWAAVEGTVKRLLPRGVADEALFGVTYHLVDEDRHRVGQLTRRIESGGARDLLDHQPVQCGAGLELLAGDGSWIAGRYEMAWTRAEHPTAMFHPHLWAGSDGAAFPINELMILRRPRGSAPSYPGLL